MGDPIYSDGSEIVVQGSGMIQKLIFDESAIKIAIEKMQGRPVFIGPDGDLFNPGVVNLLGEEETLGKWQPGDERTKQLVLGGEACREVIFYLNQFLDPKTRQRSMNRMTVPLCSLMDVVVKLLAELNDKESRHIRESSWLRQDCNTYIESSRRVKKMKEHSPVRYVRKKLAAHLDKSVFVEGAPRLKPIDILRPFGDCVVLLMLSMNYPSHWFCWIRPIGLLEDGKHYAIETMYSYPLCVRWITDLDGHVKDVGQMVLAADPRHDLQSRIMEAVSNYNNMVKAVNSTLSLIHTIPTEELQKEK
jgi:hypothetical protein